MKKILVVDDEQEIGELVGLYLKNEGYTVFSCTLGAEALACVGAGGSVPGHFGRHAPGYDGL